MASPHWSLRVLRRTVPSLIAVTALLASLLGALVSFAPPATAATYRSFTPPRYQTNDNGAIEMIGNHNQTCQPGSSVGSGASQITCAALLASNALGHNATLPMVQLDADTSATTTINSSSADLNLPAGSTVLFAGLYWSATAANSAVDLTLPRPGFSGGWVLRLAGAVRGCCDGSRHFRARWVWRSG